MKVTRKTVRGTVLGALLTLATSASAQDITIMSGSTGGTWDGLSGAVKAILETNLSGMTVNVRPGGTAANLKALSTNKADLGWSLAPNSVEALNGEASFAEGGPLKVCNVAAFHPTVLQYVTNDPDVQSLDDLRGKRVGTLPKGTGTEALARTMLDFHGIAVEDLEQYNMASFSDNSTMLKDKHTVAFLGASGMPAGGIMDMFSSVNDLRMMDITDEDMAKLKGSNGAYNRFVIKANTYPGQDQDVNTVGYATHLAINCDMSEDDAYQITKTLIEHYKDLGAVITAIGGYTLEDLTTDIGVPMHPGAVKAFKEAGAL